MIEVTFMSSDWPREEGGYGRPNKPDQLSIGPYAFEPVSWQSCNRHGMLDYDGGYLTVTYRNEGATQAQIDVYLEKARAEGSIRSVVPPLTERHSPL
ncbi:MAG: hypothetical protein H0U76_22305 [Ktedonobacteraceae bacterium]|nr:hypothetical protein [Ktedonobacteraceae bacterium]